MGWAERAIFGKIRYMNYAGCCRKFSVQTFVSRYRAAAVNAAAKNGNSTLAAQKKGNNGKKGDTDKQALRVLKAGAPLFGPWDLFKYWEKTAQNQHPEILENVKLKINEHTTRHSEF